MFGYSNTTTTTAKYCQQCHQGTAKPDRETCKQCGCTVWSTVPPTAEQSLPLLRAEAQKQGLAGFDDAMLLKFLAARKLDVTRAASLLRDHCAWKKDKFGMSHLDFPAQEDVVQMAASGFLSVPGVRDKDGSLILFVRPVCLDPDSTSPLDLLRLLWYVLDKACDDEATRANGFRVVEDLSGMEASQFSSLVPHYPKEIFQGLVGAVPARLRGIHITHQPYGFASFLMMAKSTFIPTKLGSKLHVHGEEMTDLYEHVAPEQLPTKLGGSCAQGLEGFHHDFISSPQFFPAPVA